MPANTASIQVDLGELASISSGVLRSSGPPRVRYSDGTLVEHEIEYEGFDARVRFTRRLTVGKTVVIDIEPIGRCGPERTHVELAVEPAARLPTELGVLRVTNRSESAVSHGYFCGACGEAPGACGPCSDLVPGVSKRIEVDFAETAEPWRDVFYLNWT